MNAVKEYASNFSRSIELSLDKKLQSSMETGLKHFRQNGKGSVNLRREYEMMLIQKMEQKARTLRSDSNRFYQSWTAAWRVEALVMDDK